MPKHDIYQTSEEHAIASPLRMWATYSLRTNVLVRPKSLRVTIAPSMLIPSILQSSAMVCRRAMTSAVDAMYSDGKQ